METIYLSQPSKTTVKTKVAADINSNLGTIQNPFADNGRISVTSTTNTPEPHFFKTIVDMVGEGLKQNFLGPNIDMEFLTLTVRSFASTSAKAIQQFVKPLVKRHEVKNPCPQFNQPCF